MSDRIQPSDTDMRLPKPQVKIIVSGESVYKPGMRTFLANDDVTSGTIFEGATSYSVDENYTVRGSDYYTPEDYESVRSSATTDSYGRRVTRYTICTCNTVLIGSIRTLAPGENPIPTPSPSPTPKPTTKCTCNTVKKCTCNTEKKCSCNKVCSCNSYKAPKKCTCNSQSRCKCNKVCTCKPVH